MKLELASLLLALLPISAARSRDAHSPFPPRLAATGGDARPGHDRALDLVPTVLALPAPASEHPQRSQPRDAVVQPRRGKPPPAPPLPPRQAAKRFVTWMQEHDLDGDKPWGGESGIWAFYLWHCHEERLQPVPDNMFGDALSGVVKRRQVRDRSTGKLRRFTHYVIPKLPEPVEQPRREQRRRAA